MKVLFVNPPQTASKYKFMGVIAPPLGIAYIAGVLQENNIDVEILDASAEDMDFKDVEKVANQANVSEDEAKAALEDTNGDLAEAILKLNQ